VSDGDEACFGRVERGVSSCLLRQCGIIVDGEDDPRTPSDDDEPPVSPTGLACANQCLLAGGQVFVACAQSRRPPELCAVLAEREVERCDASCNDEDIDEGCLEKCEAGAVNVLNQCLATGRRRGQCGAVARSDFEQCAQRNCR